MRTFSLSEVGTAGFHQSQIQASYAFGKKTDAALGYIYTAVPGNTNGSGRIFTRFSYTAGIGKRLSWTNGVQAELHDNQQNNYKYRLIYITRLASKKRTGFLKLSPSVSYWLFYNIGGAPVQYYDGKTGKKLVKQTPDGLHRGRLQLSVNSKITGNLSVTIYAMFQREFNWLTPEYRKINFRRPTDGKYIRPFSQFNTAGLTFTYNIKLYKKNHHAKKQPI
ncbi:MAG: hypothetical protein JNM68_16015 [Dinghuibacter sp.]|nr:hypothetical protein [Dinghuibacter sp.]